MYFLAIVLRKNIEDGEIYPAHILCQSNGRSEHRTGWRVCNVTTGKPCGLPKVMVYSPYGNDEIIRFLSNFRTRDHMHNGGYEHEATKKYYPEGALFWFECNRYGEMTGPALFVKFVPDPYGEKCDAGLTVLTKARNREVPWVETLTRDKKAMDMETTEAQLNLYNRVEDEKQRVRQQKKQKKKEQRRK